MHVAAYFRPFYSGECPTVPVLAMMGGLIRRRVVNLPIAS